MEDGRCQRNVAKCLNEVHHCLSSVGANLAGLLQDVSAPPECVLSLPSDVTRLENEARNLKGNLEALLSAHAYQQQLQISAMADRYAEIEELRSKVVTLQRENEKVSDQLALAVGDSTCLRSQLTHQSAFCASLGSVLGTLLWKASRVPPVVDLLLSGNKAADFLCLVSGTLDSFLEAFATEMPGPEADETQFIMAMGGIVTNMAAAPAGRQFLVTDPNGRDLIQQIVRVLPVIPTPSGNCLKRLLLMALYNVSINQAGLGLLNEDGRGLIFSVVANCLKPESTNELKVMALRLLLSLTCEIKDPALIAQVPQELLTRIASSDDAQQRSMAQEVSENLLKAQEKLRQAASSKKSCTAKLSGAFNRLTHEFDGDGSNARPAQPTAAWKLPSHP